MTIEECYTRLESDYGEVLRRLGREERVKKFLLRLPDDESYANLCTALQTGDGEGAFRAAHSMKGICMNLGLTALLGSASDLTESLRTRQVTEEAMSLFKQVEKDYDAAIQCIREIA